MYAHKHMYIYTAALEAAAPIVFMGLATGLELRTSVVTSRSAYHSEALSCAIDGVTCSR